MPPKALVTGGTGFIGSHLVEALAARNWRVTCLVRATSKTEFLKKFPVQFVLGSAENREILEKAVQGQDYIFHLAGRIRSASRKAYDLANRQLTRNLIEACLRKNKSLKRFVHISSIAAAGPSLPGFYFDEIQPDSPDSEYGRSKLKGEEAVRQAWHLVPATIIRPPNVYGPRQQETELLIKLISKRIVPILREKRATTSLIYVKDLIQGILLAAQSEKTRSEVYYLTDGKGYSWREIILAAKKFVLGKSLFFPFPEELILAAALLADIFNKTGIVKIFFGLKLWEAMVKTPWLFSTSKAERDFGFRTHYSLNDGLKETVEYYKKLIR
jgi:nucleoside-diphosphate-sugar epimerase